MYFELDGNFPNHEANPIDPANLVDLQARVVAEGADIGLAFDGDADRCFIVDELGQVVNPSTLTALIAVRELAKTPGATIIYNLITSKAVAEIVTENGGVPLRTRVGHSFIKAEMARTGAVFGGEHSGHFYFRDFWNADSGMLAAMHALAALSEAPDGTALSSLLTQFQRYSSSGEINSHVDDAAAALAAVHSEFAGPEYTTDELDGLTVNGPTWWFNVRASNTEPLLRLNVEGDTEVQMSQVRDRVLALIRG
jgi:phosphomannomutase